METRAKLNHLRISSRKVRLVADLIRGLDILKAQNRLRFTNKKSSACVLKLLNSAIANAISSFQMEPANLFIKKIFVDQGPTLKRWRARAFGRSASIKKRTSHITIVLEERVEGIKIGKGPSYTKKIEASKAERLSRKEKPAPKRAEKIKGRKGLAGLSQKVFRRKSI